MLFHNPTKLEISFRAGDLAWKVGPGEDCDIPPNVSYIVAARGLPLVAGTGGGARAEAVVPPPVRARLQPGVESGPEPSDAEPPADFDRGAPAVDAAAERLRAAGAVLPMKKGKGR
jgi:hypothetical protein